MNARLYDPVVGRFLSPDPYIQAPDFSQNFNRYSYALNNPLLYTDPNGEFFFSMLIGGAVNLGIQALSGKIHSFSDGLKSFGIGALSWLAGFGAGSTGGILNSTLSGASFSQILSSGLKGGIYGAGTVALIGGTIQGINSVRNGGNFFTGKGYSKLSKLAPHDNYLSLGGDAISNKNYLDQSTKELGWKPGKYNVDKINIDGISSNPKFSYSRDNGILYEYYKGYKVRGVTFQYQKTILSLKTEIYLSYHKTLQGFQVTLNHELIHAYHYGLGLNMSNNNYSEYSATMYSSQFIPREIPFLWKMVQYQSAFLNGYT